MPNLFKDADKKANDLFKKGFVTGTKYTGCVKTANGVKFTAEAAQEKKGAFKTKLSIKYADKKTGLSINKFDISSHAKGSDAPKPNLNAEITLDEPSLKDVKFNFNVGICQMLDMSDEKAELGVVYSINDKATAQVSVDPVNANANVHVVANHGNFVGGVEGTAKSSNQTFDPKTFSYGYSCFAGYNAGNLSIIGRHQKNQLNLSVFHQYSSALSLATIASFDQAKFKEDKSNAVSIKAGGKYAIDDCCSVAAQLGQNGHLKLGYSQKLYPKVKFTGSATVDLKTNAGAVKDPTPTFGFQMDFGDI